MRVLVACEFSGTVRNAFAALGWDAWSCDLLPTEAPGQHIQGDVTKLFNAYEHWDLLIAHPPCTYLCSSGLHWNKRRPERQAQTEEALRFVLRLMDAPIPRICIENPVGCISTRIRRPDQIVQPWMFGHLESKATCLDRALGYDYPAGAEHDPDAPWNQRDDDDSPSREERAIEKADRDMDLAKDEGV